MAKKKIVRTSLITDEQISPYDKIGMSMAKKMKVKTPFKKGKEAGNQNSVKTAKFEHEIISYENFMNEDGNYVDNYKQELFAFLDRPWQEDVEIDFIAMLDQYRNLYETSSKNVIQNYLRRMDKVNNKKLYNCTDAFLIAWDDLLV